MSEIVSRVFVIGVLLFYAGLVMAFLLWNLRRSSFAAQGRKGHGLPSWNVPAQRACSIVPTMPISHKSPRVSIAPAGQALRFFKDSELTG